MEEPIDVRSRTLELPEKQGLSNPEECLNCAKPFLENGVKKQKITELLIPKIGSHNKELEIVSLYNVLRFVFQLPSTPTWSEFKEESSVAICHNCSHALVQSYTAHVELMDLSHINSFLSLVLKEKECRESILSSGGGNRFRPQDHETGTRNSNQSSFAPQSPALPGPSIGKQIPLSVSPNLSVVNLIPLNVIEDDSSIGRIVARPILTKRVKQALLSTDSSTQSILIFEQSEDPPGAKRRMLVPTEFYDLPRPHPCLECGESFLQKTSLDFHSHWIHKGETKFICNHCLQPMQTDQELLLHMSTKHAGANQADYSRIAAPAPERKKGGKRSTRKPTTPKKSKSETSVTSTFTQLPLDLRSLLEETVVQRQARALIQDQSPVLPQRRNTIQNDGVGLRLEQGPPHIHQDYICSMCTRIFPTIQQRDGHFIKCSTQLKLPCYDPLPLSLRISSAALTNNSKGISKPGSSKGKRTYEEPNDDSDDDRFVIVEPPTRKGKGKVPQRRGKQVEVPDPNNMPINLTGFICSSCGRIFPSNNGRNEHMRFCRHPSGLPEPPESDQVFCPYEKCSRNKTTFHRSSLYKHIQTFHPEKEVPSPEELEQLIRVADDVRRREVKASLHPASIFVSNSSSGRVQT